MPFKSLFSKIGSPFGALQQSRPVVAIDPTTIEQKDRYAYATIMQGPSSLALHLELIIKSESLSPQSVLGISFRGAVPFIDLGTFPSVFPESQFWSNPTFV